jgi:hypothetical protein
MAALSAVFLTLLRARDHVVSSRFVFGNFFVAGKGDVPHGTASDDAQTIGLSRYPAPR